MSIIGQQIAKAKREEGMTTIEVACAAATLPCSCDYCQLHGAADCHAMRTINNPCPCSGTGRVFVLPVIVRVVCGRSYGSFGFKPCAKMDFIDGVCPRCHGRSWTPNPDGWAWWRAAFAVDIIMDIGWAESNGNDDGSVDPKGWYSYSYKCLGWNPYRHVNGEGHSLDDPEAAFFAALHAALVALGAEMPKLEVS